MRISGPLSARLQISLVVFLLGVFTPLVHAQQTLTGWFSITVVDYLPESGRPAETIYTLTEDSGARHELLIDVALMRSLGGPVALNRKRVTVVGEWESVGSDTPAQFWVHSIRLESSEGESTTPEGAYQPLQALTQTAVTGSQAWVTILCRFGDATDVTLHPVSYYEKLMGASYPALGHYWNEVSYGHIPNLRGSRVVGWYNLPRPRSYYVYDQDGDGEEESDGGRMREDCTAAADADVFFPNFWGINLVFNQNLHSDIGGFASSERLTKDGQARFWGVMWLSSSRSENASTWAHEMGHTFGLLHSSGPYGQDDPLSSPTTYDSRWDVMSGGRSLEPYPSYGDLGVHTIAYHKDFLGWIPSSRKYVASPNSTRTIILERLAQPGPDGYLMAQIPIGDSETDFYTVETRLFAGYDDEIPDEAVVIHKVDTTRADRLAQVVDIDNNSDPNDEGAMWTVGETFTDLANGLQVSIDADRATGFQVTIAYTVCAEALSSTRQLLRGRAGSASVEATAPSGCRWAATSNSPWITVIAGSGSGNGSASYTVAANPSLNARIGTLTIAGRILTVIQAGVNDNLFEDDMEDGTDSWSVPSGHPWTLTTTASYSGTYAWTDSPDGNYQNNLDTVVWSPVIDLTGLTSATLTFWHWFDFGSGDIGLVRLHPQNGEWTDLRTFTSTNSAWQPMSLDLTPFVGQSIRLTFQLHTDATETADGWYIDDVAVFSSDFETTEPPPPPQAALDGPAPNSFQSGIGLIYGWACEAQEIVIELAGTPVQAAYGTPRADTQGVCGDSNNGFGLPVNWNNLGDGEHTIRALADGVEFANTTVRVTTLGVEVLKDVQRTVVVPDFPRPGEETTLQWEESLQNFVIVPK